MSDDRRGPRFGHFADLGLGSNSDPASNLPRALDALWRDPEIEVVSCSHAWESTAIGTGGPDYLNAAVLVLTLLTKDALKARLRRIESDLGRVRTGGPSALVTIDIDLLIFNGEVLEPDLWGLAYRVVPMAEYTPGRTLGESYEPLSQAALRLAGGTRIVCRPEVLPATNCHPTPTDEAGRGVALS